MIQTLLDLNSKVFTRLECLPPVDPYTVSALSPGNHSDKDGDNRVRSIVRESCAGQSSELLRRMENEYFEAGPLEPLLSDSSITEIVVNGPSSLWCERNGKLEHVEDRFLSELNFRNFISRLSREAGIQANLESPFADGQWRGCRVHLALPPASGSQALLTLRRHPEIPFTLEELTSRDWASGQAITELKRMVRERENFLIIGGTGSGKTSALNACLMAIGERERTLIIEDTSELKVPNLASSKLLTRRDPNRLLRDIDQSELVRQALRMRPDRIVMGEIRGGEAKDLLMAFATGHSGCMGTLHADSARQALLRLEMLIQLGAPQWSLHAVRTLIWLSVNAVVVVEKTDEGARRLEGIYRIASLEDVGFLIDKKA